MRVLHVNKFLYRRGGAEGYLFDVADLQRARRRRGGLLRHDARRQRARSAVRAPTSRPGWTWNRRRPICAAGSPPPAGCSGPRSARSGLARVLADFRPDAVHLHNVYHQLSPSVVAATRRPGVPCVMTLHDYKLACPSYQMLDKGQPCDACVTGGPLQAARRACKDGSRPASTLLAVESWLHRRLGAYDGVGALIAPSRFLAGVLARAGVYPDRLRVLRHPVDVDHLALKAAPGGGVVFAGRLAPEKGVDTLIEAAALLPAGRDGGHRRRRAVPGRAGGAGRPGRAGPGPVPRPAAQGPAARSGPRRRGRGRAVPLVREPAAGGARGVRLRCPGGRHRPGRAARADRGRDGRIRGRRGRSGGAWRRRSPVPSPIRRRPGRWAGPGAPRSRATSPRRPISTGLRAAYAAAGVA